MTLSQEYIVNGANGDVAIVRFPTRLPEVDGIGGVVGRWEGDVGTSDDRGSTSSADVSQVALDATFCDEPVAFEHDDRVRRIRRDVTAAADVDLADLELGEPHWGAMGLHPAMERKTRGIVREPRGADIGRREAGAAVRFEVMKTESAGFGRDGGATDTKKKRRSDWSGLDESGSSLKSEERRRRACGSFWMGVFRGVLPVVLVVWCCFGKRGRWDERWLAYGTTVGLCMLIGAAIAVILVNLT